MLKRALTIGLASAAITAALSAVTVRARSPEPVTAADALPAYEIVTRALEWGLRPIGEPIRSGPYYVLPAYDPQGREVRVVADAAQGDILSIAPVRPVSAAAPYAYAPNAYAPRYERGPRIIHVPQPGEEDEARLPNVRRVVPNEDDVDDIAPPPRRKAVHKPQAPQKKSDAPPRRKPYNAAAPARTAPVERRTVLSAPLHDGPSPVRPTPRFTKETGEKFTPPPPPGYTPPAKAPQETAAPAEAASGEPAPAETAPQDNAPAGD